MVTKRKTAAVDDGKLSATVKESAQQIWLAGLGAFAKAQKEGNKVFDALIREGESLQLKTRKLTEDKVAEIASKATGSWDRLEQVFEDRVARALGRMGVPTKKDVDALSKRVEELSAQLEKLSASKAAKPVRRSVKAD